MKQKISNLQIAFLAGNTAVAATLVTIPQALMDASLQNTWLVPLVLMGGIFIFIQVIFIGFNKVNNVHRIWDNDFLFTKIVAAFTLIFLIHILVRDLRIITGFTRLVLLPTTPAFYIMMIFLLSMIYMAWDGIEVIARFTELYFLYFIFVILFIPLSLADQILWERFEPILGFRVIPSILESSFIGFAWVGEIIVLILVITMVKPVNDAKRSILIGTGIGLFLLLLLIGGQISVLGAQIIKHSIYPSYSLVQQIRITEFLDRLDLVLVSFYFPTIFAKIGLIFFGIRRCLEIITKQTSNITSIPLALLMGLLSLLLFENKAHKVDYEIFTWASLGLFLEVSIGVMFVFLVMKVRKSEQKKDEKIGVS